LGEPRRNWFPDNNSADKLVDAVKILFQDAGSTPAASTFLRRFALSHTEIGETDLKHRRSCSLLVRFTRCVGEL